MPLSVDQSLVNQVLAAMERFDAENENIDQGGPTDSLGGVHASRAQCEKTWRESMRALAKIWKHKAKALARSGDPDPKYNAALTLITPYRNVQTAYQNCLRQPTIKVKTPKTGADLKGPGLD